MNRQSDQCNLKQITSKRCVAVLFSGILTISFLFGQEYKPFPISNAAWNVLHFSNCDNFNPSTDTSLLRYTILGDTVYNEVKYKKLMVTNGDTVNPITSFSGGLREDSKKIYYFGRDFSGYDYYEEILLYDFNAQENDTIYHDEYGSKQTIVLDIDSVLIDDHYRKRYKVDNGWWYHREDYIIEGMGSVLNGLLGHITMIPTCGSHYWEHICYSHNSKVLYKNPRFFDCFAGLNLSSTESSETNQIKLFPNPFKEYFEISIPKQKNSKTLKIHNINGQLISQMEIIDTHLQVALKGPPGIYIISILDWDGKILKAKIVKQ